jgi:hypothetical protein
MNNYVQSMKNTYHPICGYAVELLFCLGNLGRYCRKVLDGAIPDLATEAAFEQQLLDFANEEGDDGLKACNECFRKHGLLMLYRICGVPGVLHATSPEEWDCDNMSTSSGSSNFSNLETEIRTLALELLDEAAKIPLGSPMGNTLSLPLLSAGSELDAEHSAQREAVRARLQSLHARNRCPPNLWACSVLDMVWEFRDENIYKPSWLETMLAKGWRLCLV